MSLVTELRRKAGDAAAALRLHLLGPLSRGLYDIAPGYRHRTHTAYFDDKDNSDEWQREVYVAARLIMREQGLRRVHDIGCGSGYKLVHILGEFETMGLDLPQTIGKVRERYPDRNWISGSLDDVRLPRGDLVICADVAGLDGLGVAQSRLAPHFSAHARWN